MRTENPTKKYSIVKTIICYIILALICTVVFWFSSQGGDNSTSQSNFVVDFIIDKFFPNFTSYGQQEQLDLHDFLSVIVRKGAHFSVYTLMGAFAFIAFFVVRRYGLRFLMAVGFTFIYACTDEFHQLYVPGRTGKFTDVLLDTCGGMLGAFIILTISVVVIHARELTRLRQRVKYFEDC